MTFKTVSADDHLDQGKVKLVKLPRPSIVRGLLGEMGPLNGVRQITTGTCQVSKMGEHFSPGETVGGMLPALQEPFVEPICIKQLGWPV